MFCGSLPDVYAGETRSSLLWAGVGGFFVWLRVRGLTAKFGFELEAGAAFI